MRDLPFRANGNSSRFGQISVLILVLPLVRQDECCGGQMPVASPAPHLHHGLMLSTLKRSSPSLAGLVERVTFHDEEDGSACCG